MREGAGTRPVGVVAAVAAVWAGILVLPLASFQWGADPGVPLRLVVAAFVLAAAAIALRTTGTFLARPILWAILAGLVAFAASAMLGGTPLLSLMGRFPRYEGAGVLLLYAGLAAAGAVVIGGRRIQQALLAMTLLQVILVMQCLLDLIGGSTRVVTLVGNASDVAIVGLTGVGLLLWHALNHRLVWLWVGVAAAVIVVVLSASRGGWLGLAAIVLATMVLGGCERGRRPVAVLGALVLVASAGVLVVPASRARLLGEGLASQTAVGRLLMWRETLELIAARLFLGWGPSRFVDEIGAFQSDEWSQVVGPDNPVNSPHNIVLQVLASTGVLGLAAAVVLAAAVTILLCRARTTWSSGVLLASIGVGIALCFHFTTLWSLGPLLICGGAALKAPVTRIWPRACTLLLVAVGAAALGVWTMTAEADLARGVSNLAAGTEGADTQLVQTLTARAWDADYVWRGSHALVGFAADGQADAASVVPLVSQACSALPHSSACLQTFGQAQLLAGQEQEAVDTLRRSLDYAPTNADSWLWLGEAQASAGDLDGAVDSLVRVTELRPQEAAPWDALQVAYEKLGEDDKAATAKVEADARR